MKKPVYDSARVTPPDNEILIQSLAYKRERVARADAKADLLTNELFKYFQANCLLREKANDAVYSFNTYNLKLSL